MYMVNIAEVFRVSLSIAKGLFQKKNKRGFEDIAFPGVLKEENGNFRGQLNEKEQNFQGCSIKTHVEFPWVLVFDLGISNSRGVTQFC